MSDVNSLKEKIEEMISLQEKIKKLLEQEILIHVEIVEALVETAILDADYMYACLLALNE